jgi:hypothetical protein
MHDSCAEFRSTAQLLSGSGFSCLLAALVSVACRPGEAAPPDESRDPSHAGDAAPDGLHDTQRVDDDSQLFFTVEEASIRLAPMATQMVPELIEALATTHIEKADEQADLVSAHGPVFHVQLAAAGEIDVAPLAMPSRSPESMLDGIMYDTSHVSLSFTGHDLPKQVARSLWRGCIEGAPLDPTTGLQSARRELSRGVETRDFVVLDGSTGEVLRWAAESGHPLHTAPPADDAMAPVERTWQATVFDLRPDTVVIRCERRYAEE